MAVSSKYFQITNQLLLEYSYNQKQINEHSQKQINEHSGATDTEVIMYWSNDGLQYCLELTENNLNHLKFSDENFKTYYYTGYNKNLLQNLTQYINSVEKPDDNIFGAKFYFNENEGFKGGENDDKEWGGTIIKSGSEKKESIRKVNVIHDKIRIYILTGYVFNALAGISLKVKGYISTVKNSQGKTKRINNHLILLDWFMPKEILSNEVKWLTTPLYLNSKFYDRYIEIDVLSLYDISLNPYSNIDFVYEYNDDFYRGTFDNSSQIIIEFATVQPEYLTLCKQDSVTYESIFNLDPIRELSIDKDSNSKFFNVCIYEDEETNSIIYYPVYGEGTEMKDFDIDVMLAIDSGNIPMYNISEMDKLNEGMDDFIETYGDNVCRWVIINELSITYLYDYIFKPEQPDNTTNSLQRVEEYYTNTIDYTNKTPAHGKFWKSYYRPYAKQLPNMTLQSIILKYTCHLYNRMNNIDIIKVASIIVDPQNYNYNNRIINTNSNIIQYKVVNKINKVSNLVNNGTKEIQEKLIRSYYDVTNIIIKEPETGKMYTNGVMTLRLKHTNSNYMLRLYTTNEDNVRIPYNLTGIVRHKLVFPSILGERIEIFPNIDSNTNNLVMGILIFYISDEKVKQIMQVPSSERYFAIMTDTENNKQESTLYEGKVDYFI